MKKIIVTIALVMTSVLAFSQKSEIPATPLADKEDREVKKQNREERFAKELNLTDAQSAQIKTIKENYNKKEEPLKEQLKTLREEKTTEISTVLNDEQKAKLKEMKDGKNRKPHGDRRNSRK